MHLERTVTLHGLFTISLQERFMIPTSMEFLGLLSLALLHAPSPAAPELHNHAALLQEVQKLATDYPNQIQSLAIGDARSGRKIPGLRIAASQKGQPAQPAILLVAGLDASRAYTSSMALDHARQLAEGFNQSKQITELLQSTTVYIIPRLDVDAGERRFQAPLLEDSASGFGVDNDRDGSQGEDGPLDINGDGFISVMRQVHREGEWVEDATDPRVLRKRDAGKAELGKWRLLPEGLDSDGDEKVAEDAALDAIVNRNFPRNWTEHSAQAGRYPTHEPSSLALVEFLLQHRDIALVVTYGDEFNLAEKPASQKDEPSGSRGSVTTGIYESDLASYEELGRRYRELTENKTPAAGEEPGSLQGFAYHHRGLLTLNIDPWSVPLDAKSETSETEEEGAEKETEQESEKSKTKEPSKAKDEPKPTDDAKRMLWFDQNSVEARLPWTAFNHPQLGPVEIGGFKPYALVEPPADLRAEITRKHFEFFTSLAGILPRLRLVDVEGKALGDGLVEVKAVLFNDALLPQQTRAAQRSGAVRPARVNLVLPSGTQLMGGNSQQLVDDLEALGGRRELRWLVAGYAGRGAIRIEVSTDNAGSASVQVEVK